MGILEGLKRTFNIAGSKITVTLGNRGFGLDVAGCTTLMLNIRAEFRANYPRLTAELISDEPVERLRRALDSLLRGWRNQTVPWIFTGVLLFAAGIAWPRVETWRSGRTVPRPPIPKSSGSGPSSSAESSSETPSAKIVDPPVSVEEKHDVGDGAKREATGSEPDSDPDR